MHNKLDNEPKEAFPYSPPTDEIKEKYKHIFEINNDLDNRAIKVIFDKIVSFPLFLISVPILLILKVAYVIEGFLIPENKGPLLFYYWGVSKGKKFKKWKIRLIKNKFVDDELAANGDWLAYAKEWTPQSRTYVGQFAKKWYLDELPQFWTILKGQMSIVGPRPLSVIHYERDLQQGNITRKLLKGGMLGLGHINKGTAEMGNPLYEYEYIDSYIHMSPLRLLFLDIWIIYKGFLLIIKGGGH